MKYPFPFKRYFYNLATGCIISRRRWISLPMPIEVINVVHELAEKDKASKGIHYNDGTSELINEEQTAEQADMSDKIDSNVVESAGVGAGVAGDWNTTFVDAEISGVDAKGEDADYMLENREISSAEDSVSDHRDGSSDSMEDLMLEVGNTNDLSATVADMSETMKNPQWKIKQFQSI